MSETKTPYELFGIECRNGWKSIIKPVLDYIEEFNSKTKGEKIVIMQIKEKFGGLSIETNFVTHELFQLIIEAENKSYHVCEICGSTEDVGIKTSDWAETLCLECVKKEAEKKPDGYIVWSRHKDKTTYFVEAGQELEDFREWIC